MKGGKSLPFIFFLACCLVPVALFSLGRISRNTSKDSYCMTCHEMRPFFAARNSGPHKDVECRDCHIKGGLLKSLHAKINGLSYLFQEGKGVRPQAVLGKATCTAKGCHGNGGRDGIIYRGTIFNHFQHKSVSRCTICHSLSREPGHCTRVDPVSCFACHMEKGRKGSKACVACHKMPGPVLVGPKEVFEHDKAWNNGWECSDCHGNSHFGNAGVRTESCGKCHKGMKAAGEDLDGNHMHYLHILKSSVPCKECHADIPHHSPFPWETGFPEKGKLCSHSSGIGGKGRARAFIRMNCSFCHSRKYPRSKVCTACHEPR